MFSIRKTALLCPLFFFVPSSSFQSSIAAEESETEQETSRERRLTDYLNGVKLVGKFTIDGIVSDGKAEEYTISKCEKLPEENMYRMTARIKYGDVDSELPLNIKILWSGNTPVITLDKFWIPGMGTFGARVLIHADRYAGTWQHDAAGGHMFGRIVKLSSEETPEKAAEEEESSVKE